MSKQTKQSEIKSIKDAGYRVASNRDGVVAVAQFVMAQQSDFLDNPKEEIVAELAEGFAVRFHENRGATFYKITSEGVHVPAKEGEPGVVAYTVHTAMSYTGQQFGKLKGEDPHKHAAIKALRDAFSTYKSECMSALTTAIRRILNNGKTRQRGANDDYTTALSKMFDSYDKRAANAKKRGDETADQAKFRTARDAFWKIYNG